MHALNAFAATAVAESRTPTPTDRRDVDRHDGSSSPDVYVLPSDRAWYAGDEPSHIHIPRPSRRMRSVAAEAPALDA